LVAKFKGNAALGKRLDHQKCKQNMPVDREWIPSRNLFSNSRRIGVKKALANPISIGMVDSSERTGTILHLM